MTTTTSRRAVRAGTKPKLRVVQSPRDRETDLEMRICDLHRAARIAFLMAKHDEEDGDDDDLRWFAVEQVERLASELRKAFYADEAVQS